MKSSPQRIDTLDLRTKNLKIIRTETSVSITSDGFDFMDFIYRKEALFKYEFRAFLENPISNSFTYIKANNIRFFFQKPLDDLGLITIEFSSSHFNFQHVIEIEAGKKKHSLIIIEFLKEIQDIIARSGGDISFDANHIKDAMNF